MSSNIDFKCYMTEIEKEKYYWYISDKSSYVYGNDLSVNTRADDSKHLDRIVDVILFALTEKTIHLIYKKTEHIYGIRQEEYDIKGETE